MRKSKKKSFEFQPLLGNRRQFNIQRDSLKVQKGLEGYLVKKKRKKRWKWCFRKYNELNSQKKMMKTFPLCFTSNI